MGICISLHACVRVYIYIYIYIIHTYTLASSSNKDDIGVTDNVESGSDNLYFIS